MLSQIPISLHRRSVGQIRSLYICRLYQSLEDALQVKYKQLNQIRPNYVLCVAVDFSSQHLVHGQFMYWYISHSLSIELCAVCKCRMYVQIFFDCSMKNEDRTV